MDSKIIQFPKRPTIFGQKTRAALVDGLKSEETVSKVEDILCREIVACTRTLGTRFGKYLGKKVGQLLDHTIFEEKRSS